MFNSIKELDKIVKHGLLDRSPGPFRDIVY